MNYPFVTLLDFIGTFAFAISGGLVAVRHRLDLFGVLVLSFAAATAGGMTRDVILNITPVAVTDWRYLALSIAAGLALFAVIGSDKALHAGIGPVGAVMMGILSGIGGGIVRDVLVAQVPTVLRYELYALAALAAAVVMVIGHELGLPHVPVAVAGATLCFTLRWLAVRKGWRLPVAGGREAP